jgi:hypothetical protein
MDFCLPLVLNTTCSLLADQTAMPLKSPPASSSCKFAPISPKAQRKPRQTIKFEHVHFYLDGGDRLMHSFERVQFSHNQRQDQQSPAS